jgi:hypothetical protein
LAAHSRSPLSSSSALSCASRMQLRRHATSLSGCSCVMGDRKTGVPESRSNGAGLATAYISAVIRGSKGTLHARSCVDLKTGVPVSQSSGASTLLHPPWPLLLWRASSGTLGDGSVRPALGLGLSVSLASSLCTVLRSLASAASIATRHAFNDPGERGRRMRVGTLTNRDCTHCDASVRSFLLGLGLGLCVSLCTVLRSLASAASIATRHAFKDPGERDSARLDSTGSARPCMPCA